ncbi:MAG: ribosome biogenesis GTPase Der [candidate division WOR-3 bacterium]
MATVVIVGRPNTGKSTLFNRIVGGRIAITLEESGITRDRIIRRAEWCGRSFNIVDTGGMVPDSAVELEREVNRQVGLALSEAAVVVLVTDGAAGLAPLDEEIARRLRRQGLGFILCVNKSDSKRRFDSSEFHRLGAEILLPISAEHGDGVDALLDEIVRRLPEEKRQRSQPAISLAILGRPNTGKSTLLNRLLSRERAIVSPIPGTTRDAIEDEFEFEGRRFRLIDTAGIRRRTKVDEPVEFYSVSRALDTIRRCEIALIVIDATEGPANQDKRIVNLVEEQDKGIVIVANKLDIVPRELLKKVQDYVRRELEFAGYAPIVFISALKGRGVVEVIRQALAVHAAGNLQVSAALLRRTVLEELKLKPPRRGCRVLGLTQAGTRPPAFRLRLSDPKAADPVFRRRVLNLLRAGFGFAGWPIRLRIGR